LAHSPSTAAIRPGLFRRRQKSFFAVSRYETVPAHCGDKQPPEIVMDPAEHLDRLVFLIIHLLW